jgi:hypothetical protein
MRRLHRNWISLLQELRVVQTGVQLLTGILLTLPFRQRFDLLDQPMHHVYLVTVALSAGTTWGPRFADAPQLGPARPPRGEGDRGGVSSR